MKHLLLCLMVSISLGSYSQDSVLIFHKKTSLPAIPRVDCNYFVIDSNFYLVGGADSNNAFLRDVWCYNLSSDTWHQKSNFPGGVFFGGNSFVINGVGYLCGGRDSLSNYHYNSQFWEYHPATDTWIRKGDFPGIIGGAGANFVYANKGYIGLDNGDSGTKLWQYDPLTDHWTAMDSLPADGRYGSAVTVIDSFAYIVGGYYASIGGCTAEMWKYHIQGNHWEQLSDIPGSERGFSPIWGFKNALIFAYGTLNNSNAFKLLDDKYYYNLQDNNWQSIVFQGFVDSTADGISFMVGNTGYYFGGTKTVNPWFSYYNDLWSFDATPLLMTGVEDIKTDDKLSVHPNPVSAHGMLTISSIESGEVSFYNTIGQLLYTSLLDAGSNHISCESLHSGAGVVCYHATLRDGRTESGRVVIVGE